MKKMKKVFGALLALPLLLSGCQTQKADLDIEFDVFVPTAYINEEYDFSEVLVIEEGVKYNLEVYYYDYYNKVEKSLDVKNDYYFTPLELFDITVVVNAQKGSAKLSKSKTIPVSQKIDAIDELLISAGYSGWGDTGIIKEAVLDEQYFKGENSHSALSVHFQGSNPYTWGTTFLSLNNFRLLPLWSDQTWENAVVHFWVYNPTDYPLEFQMRVCDNLTNLVDVDWGQALNNPQFAQPNEWAEINFSLKHMGVNHTLYQNEDGTRDDSVIVKVKYGGTPTGGLEVYSYQFYVDDVDVIPYSEERFPDLDTKCYATAETIEYGWENMVRDDGWSRANVLFDRDLVNSTAEQTSLSSMFLTFKGVTLGENDFHNGYSVILNPEVEFEASDLPSFRHGTLDFDVQFSNDISDKSVKIICVQDGWKIFSRFNVTPVNGANDWMHVSIDFGEHSDCYSINKGIRLGFGFPGITESNKATANVHIDNIIFNQNGGIPEADIPVTRGMAFAPGFGVDFEALNLTDTMILDFRFTSGAGTKVVFMIGDGWLNYYGYYALNYDGTLDGNYNGFTVQTLEDGYYRVTIKINELDVGYQMEGINKIDLFYMHGEYTNATGYVDFINPTLY